MSQLTQYPEYGDGVVWAPRTPAHWSAVALKWVADIYAGGTPDKANLDYWENGTVPWLNSGAVNAGVITKPSELITEDALANSSARWVPARSVVIALAGQGKTKGTPARLEIDSTTNQSMAAVVPSSAVDYRFVCFWLSVNYQSIRNLGGGDLRDGLNLQHIGSIEIPLPPLSEQQTIADFLDVEAAKIDTLVTEQEGLVGVLRERRSAVIAQATGWSDGPPPHWNWKRLSWLFRATGSGTTPAPEDIVEPDRHTIPWVTTGELREATVTTTRKAVTAESIATYSALKVHPAGSLLIAMYGATIGRMGILGVPAASNQACCALIEPVECVAKFVQYSLQAAKHELVLDAAGGGQPNINQDKVRSFRIPVPTLNEQHQIVAHLDEQIEKIDALIAEAEGVVAVAKERRAALITAAVTGQIDVRGEVA